MSDSPKPNPGKSGLFKNWLGLTGGVLVLASCFAFVFLFVLNLTSARDNPYLGILTFVVSPAFFLLGAVLIGIGKWLETSHAKKGLGVHALTIDFDKAKDRKALVTFIAASVIFLMVTALGSYQTYHYTESVHFCGEACHEPMKPEFVAYQNSPHAKVACAECHVGSGPANYVKAKLNGVHQLVGVITGDYNRPIKTPIKGMPLTQDTCEQCHWPDRFIGTKEKIYTHFLADETNTQFTVRLSLNVGGGGDAANSQQGGIHWHMNLANKVEYIATDDQRQNIPWVRFTDSKGQVTEYRSPKFTNDISKHEIRRMDCMDCHSRPAHDFKSPNDAVDIAMAAGRIPSSVPWVKSNLVAVLTAEYSTEAEATQKIETQIKSLYGKLPQVETLVAEAKRIYTRNFFPEMKVDWRVHADNISHKDWPGCFRCHDGSHKSSDGKKSIKASDCNSCHLIVAQGNGAELEKMNPKGHAFFHIDAEYSDFSCNSCHTGAFPK